MKRFVAVAGSCLIGLLLSLPSTPAPPTGGHTGGNPDRGLRLFEAYCSACHGDEGRGDGPMAARLRRDFEVAPPDLVSSPLQDSWDDEAIAAAIRTGSKAHRPGFMPGWSATLDPGQLEDLVAFVRDLGRGGAPAAASIIPIQEHLELGRALYAAHCLVCHGRRGRGDGPFLEGFLMARPVKPPPDLSDPGYYRERTDAQLEQGILARRHPGALPAGGSSWWDGPFDEEEASALILYLRTLPLLPREESGKG